MAEDDHSKRFERFFSLLGYAITRWAHIDRSLFDLCKFALNTTEHKTAIVFHRSPNIGDHLALANALIHATDLKREQLKHWENIAVAVEKLLPFRNDIAHNPPTQVAHMSARLHRSDLDVKQWWEIRTEPTKLLHQPKNKKRREMKAKEDDLLKHIRKVNRAQTAFYALQWELMGPPPGTGPAVRVPTFPANLDQDDPD
jgi:hypothetical protein